MVVDSARIKTDVFQKLFASAQADPTIIPERERGSVRGLLASIQLFIFAILKNRKNNENKPSDSHSLVRYLDNSA
jgi:hypothetical protein